MTPEQLDRARKQLAPYGYSLTDSGRLIMPSGKPAPLQVAGRGSRYRVGFASDNALVWSGPDLGRFVEAFWYAKRQAA